MNGKMEGEVRGTMFLGCAYLKYAKDTNLAPVSNLDVLSVGDRTVISHLANICPERFRARRGCFGAHGWRPQCMNGADR